VKEVIVEANNQVWLMADLVLLMDMITEKIKNNPELSWQILIPAKSIEASGYKLPPSQLRDTLRISTLGDVSTGKALNERRAGVTFPDATGRLDFNSGFRSDDPAFSQVR
jgi:hypothetical protein